MNQALANKLNEEGAIVLILDMQKGAEIGLDYNSWLVGESFLGFKMIPLLVLQVGARSPFYLVVR